MATHPEPGIRRATRVVLADDHAIVRQGLASLMKPHEWIEVVGVATSGFELLRILGDTSVDVAVVDVTMPGPEISDLACQITKRSPETRLVALTNPSLGSGFISSAKI